MLCTLAVFRYTRYLKSTLRFRWPLALIYIAVSLIFVCIFLPRVGTEIFPDVAAPLLQIRLRAPTGTRIEQTEPLVLKALELIKQTVGPDNVTITSGYLGTQLGSYPVGLTYLFTASPQEAVIRVGLKEDMKGDEAVPEHIRAALRQNLPNFRALSKPETSSAR